MKYKIGNEPAKQLEVGKLYSDLPGNAACTGNSTILKLVSEDDLGFEYVYGDCPYSKEDGLYHFLRKDGWYPAELIDECE